MAKPNDDPLIGEPLEIILAGSVFPDTCTRAILPPRRFRHHILFLLTKKLPRALGMWISVLGWGKSHAKNLQPSAGRVGPQRVASQRSR